MADATTGADRSKLATERENPRTTELDTLDTLAAVRLVQAEDARIHEALAGAAPCIAKAVDLVADRLRAGGRLMYVGAGTSGRLGVLDASECPPTFRSDPEQVIGIIAGGPAALTRAIEGAEDDQQAARAELEARSLGPRDVVFGIAAGGTTAFVHAALDHARAHGAATIFLACVPASEAPDAADVSIRVPTGPEVLCGSTRLKAGTATKLVLNTVTTLAFARLGKVHGNLMVDVETGGNAKLRDRGARLVARLCQVAPGRAAELLDAAGGRVKVAVVMHAHKLERAPAEALLGRHAGLLRAALAADA